MLPTSMYPPRMDITEFARLGGLARAKSLTRAQRVASAKKAIRARWAKRDALVTAKARRNAARRKLAA